MKKRWSRLLNGTLSFLFACTLAGCQSDESKNAAPSPAAVLKALSELEGTKSAGDVQQTFSKLIASTSEAYSHCYQVASSFSVSGASESSDGNVSITNENVSQEDSQFSVLTCFYEDRTLYEVLRYSATRNSDPYIGIVRMNEKSTLQLNCLPVSAEESIFQNAPKLILDYTQEDENQALQNLKGADIENALLSEESRLIAPLFGTISPACYQQPQNYSFSFEETDGASVLTIELASPQPILNSESSQNADTQNQTDSEAEQAGTLEKQTIEITVDPDTGAITKADSESEITDANGNRQVQRNLSWISAASSAQDIGFLKDLFADVENRTLPIKGEFTLDMNFVLPEGAQAYAG